VKYDGAGKLQAGSNCDLLPKTIVDQAACFRQGSAMTGNEALISGPTVRIGSDRWPAGIDCQTRADPAQVIRFPFYYTAGSPAHVFYGVPGCMIGFSSTTRRQFTGATRCPFIQQQFLGSIENNLCFQLQTPIRALPTFEDGDSPPIAARRPSANSALVRRSLAAPSIAVQVVAAALRWPSALSCASVTSPAEIVLLRFFYRRENVVSYGSPNCMIRFDLRSRKQISGRSSCRVPDPTRLWALDGNPCFLAGLVVDGLTAADAKDFLSLPPLPT